PMDIRNGVAAQKDNEVSCIVKKSMDDLTDAVNMSTGIRHHADNDLAKTYILALHNNGEDMSAGDVRTYLVKDKGWKTDHAQDVYDLIETLNAGKHFQGGSRDKESWNYHIERWQQECDEK